MDKPATIALLIDADNAAARRIDVILGELSAFGEAMVRRAYGNWTKPELKGWVEVLHEHGIRPVQQFDPTKGKNASDIALAVDAVEILHTQRPDAFALVSSDADFTPLVLHLREHGAAVYGFGDAKTPAPFQSACSRFLVLDRLTTESDRTATSEERTEDAEAATPLRVTPEQLRGDAKLVALLRRAVDRAADEAGWAYVGTVGSHISNQSSFDPRNYGYAKLSKLLEATGLFEVRDQGETTVAVRDSRRTEAAPPAPRAAKAPATTVTATKAAAKATAAATTTTTPTKRTSRGGRGR